MRILICKHILANLGDPKEDAELKKHTTESIDTSHDFVSKRCPCGNDFMQLLDFITCGEPCCKSTEELDDQQHTDIPTDWLIKHDLYLPFLLAQPVSAHK